MSEPIRRRRALTHVGGAVETEGDAADAARLAHALEVPPSADADDDPARSHVHGFHSYPARMHPETAARLVEAFVPPGGRVLDPFCGSGTVLVEGSLAGRSVVGTDLNPLAVRLAEAKLRPRTPAELERLLTRVRDCAAHADERRKRKAGATRRFPHEDVALFEPHVLLELDSLRDKIRSLGSDPVRGDLELVLSSVLVKLSRKAGDTSDQRRVRRTAPGFASKLLVRKTEDLARRLAEFAEKRPQSPPESSVFVADATKLTRDLVGPVDAIITSPPYAATYDYLAHHALRLRWLDLDAGPLARGELGSRSAYRSLGPDEARTNWSRELGRFLDSAAKLLPHNGPLILLLADSAVRGVALRAEEILAQLADQHGFRPAARASQARPHFHGPTVRAFEKLPRREHAILLRRREPLFELKLGKPRSVRKSKPGNEKTG